MRAGTRVAGWMVVMAGLVVAPGGATAGPYDGTRPFLCAVATIMECAGSGQCERHSAEDADVPTFIKVDVPGQAITTGSGKRSVLRSVTRQEGGLILQGGENGRGWSATIDEDTGRMAVAIVDHDYTFSLFGTCTIP